MLDFLLHLQDHVQDLIVQYGPWVYAILGFIIFAETAFVIFPFLPGDSLLFAVGLFSAEGFKGLNFIVMFFVLTGCAIVGNVVNYFIGQTFGARLFARPNSKFFSQKNLAKTHEFFERHGGRAIVISRFVPVIRAFAPFVAGMGAMKFQEFMIYNVIGGVLWVGVCMGAGGLLGRQPIVQQHFELAILGLVILSLLPIAFEVLAHKMRERKKRELPE